MRFENNELQVKIVLGFLILFFLSCLLSSSNYYKARYKCHIVIIIIELDAILTIEIEQSCSRNLIFQLS